MSAGAVPAGIGLDLVDQSAAWKMPRGVETWLARRSAAPASAMSLTRAEPTGCSVHEGPV